MNQMQQELESEYFGGFDSVSERYAETKADADAFALSELEAEYDRAEINSLESFDNMRGSL